MNSSITFPHPFRWIPILILFIAGCDTDNGNPADPNDSVKPEPPAAILPLSVGNTWKYAYTKLSSTFLGGRTDNGVAELTAVSKSGDVYEMQLRIYLKDTLTSINTFRISNVSGKVHRYDSTGRYCIYSKNANECTSNLITGWRVESTVYSYVRSGIVDTVKTTAGIFLDCARMHYFSSSSVVERESHEYYATHIGPVSIDCAAITGFGGYAEWFTLKEYILK